MMKRLQGDALRRYGVPAAILFLLSVVLVALKIIRIDHMQGDTALFLQLTENIAAHGTPTSSVFAYVWAYLHNGLDKMPADRVAADPLLPTLISDTNVIHLHTYFVMFPLGLIATIVPAKIVLFSAFVLAFTGLIFMVYVVLVRRGVSVAAACLFVVLVMTHPAWGGSLLFGQFYPDRLFIPVAFALMALASCEKSRRAWLIVAAIVCASINERGGLVAGMTLLLYVLLYWKSVSDRTFKIILGCALFVFGELMVKCVVFSEMYAKYLPMSMDRITYIMHNPRFFSYDAVFILVNASLFAIALFERRAAFIALAAMMPNIIGGKGGAEKLGWVTHYHSFYFPILVWAATLGFARAYRMARERETMGYFYGAGAAALLYLGAIDPYVTPPTFSLAHLANTFVPQVTDEARDFLNPQGIAFAHLSDEIAAAVPEGATVSTPEAAMTHLYRGRTLYFFPAGIDHADYAVLSVMKRVSTRITYGGFTSFLGPREQERANALLVRRLRRDGYDLDHPVVIAPLGMAIVKRLHAEGADVHGGGNQQ